MSFKNKNKIFVIAEAGSNWKSGTIKEDLERTEKLIRAASKAGADAIKFQTFKSESVYAHNAGQIDYLKKISNAKSINEIFEKISMPYEMLEKISKLCKKYNISFMSTPFSVEDAKQVDKYVKIHKIASYENNHSELLEFIAKTKKPVLISTGASTLDEIDFAIKIMKKNHSGKVALLQCTACYPTPIEALNLNSISVLKERYNVEVGLSDHSLDPKIAPILAIGLGATIIEKHFTIDKTLPGPDHSFALEPEELKTMIQSIRIAEKIKGIKEKKVLREEKTLQRFAKRSIQAIKQINKGEKIVLGKNVDVLRPGNQLRGEEPRFLEKIIGGKTNRKIKAGEGVNTKDLMEK